MMFAEAAINEAANDANSTPKVTLLFPEQINPATITVKNVIVALTGRVILIMFMVVSLDLLFTFRTC